MANMIKFYRGLVNSLPTTGENGALYITTDEGAIYYGTGTGMKRLGDFIQVDSVSNLPTDGANTSALYYCVAENILAKWNGSTWIQINKQPTAEELKTLLGLGSMAYKSEVAEGDLNADLKAKVNAAAEGNHSHANKALLDTYTQTEADLADAVAKKHAHANADELAKIADGDKAKWDAVAADHLTSTDKTALENSIKEAKQAGTDANTNVEAYKVTNDARVKAVEDDIAEITDGTNGILANAKAYADGKDGAIAEAKAAGTTAQSNLEAYQTSNNAALAGVKATAEAAATKEYADAELAKKVDKVDGKSLVLDTEIAKLAGVSAGANKVEASDVNGKIKIDGVETTIYTHPANHAISEITGLQDALNGLQAKGDYAAEEHTHTKDEITDFAHAHTASEITDFDASVKAYDYATKAEAQGYANAKDEAIAAAKKAGDDAQDAVDALAELVGTLPEGTTAENVVAYIDAKTANIASDETVGAIDNRVKAIEADYLVAADKTELSEAIAAEKERAEGVEEGLQNQINLIMNNPGTKDVIDSIAEFTQYVADHGTIAEGMRTDINKNKEDIAAINNADTGILKQAKDYADGLADNYAAAEHDHVVADITDFESAVAAKVESYGYATTGYADGKASAAQAAAEATAAGALASAKTELQAEIDADVKVVNDAFEGYKTSNDAEVAKKANSADVYAKTETYTQAEVDALIEAVHTWNEF